MAQNTNENSENTMTQEELSELLKVRREKLDKLQSEGKDPVSYTHLDVYKRQAMARSMVMKYGMSDKLGPIQFGDDQDEVFLGREIAHSRNYGEDVATIIDNEVRQIMENAYSEAIRLLKENINVLHASAKLLVEKEKVTGDEFRKLFKDTSEVLGGIELNESKTNENHEQNEINETEHERKYVSLNKPDLQHEAEESSFDADGDKNENNNSGEAGE